jgi:hypothetical protein
MSKIRYLKITLVDGTRFILRIVGESPISLRGIEVNAEGDEVVPPGACNRLRIVGRDLIAKTVEMRMSNKYATLEGSPRKARRTPTPEIQQLHKDARLWWQIAKAEAKARFGGSADAMERAIAIEKKLIALGVTPPRRPKDFAG